MAKKKDEIERMAKLLCAAGREYCLDNDIPATEAWDDLPPWRVGILKHVASVVIRDRDRKPRVRVKS